ncbi:unnamed protein product [Porites lobata]|uniref:procollagen-proline 4-dioxygenase n=1 Tax=Porites lobata TaxID=104759 RepID=A0ABN8MX69_9CNID|nr:unnamed protein product [Porites lobata]
MVMPFCSYLRTSILFAATFSFSQTQIFTALIHMTDFVVLEQSFYSYLEKYLQNKPSASSEFHRFAHLVGQHVKDIEDDDREVFLGHPVNSYLLVRRFFREWRIVMEKLAAIDPVAKELFELIKEDNSSYPDKQVLQGCALAIFRIQDVYNISAERIASGKLSHKTLSPEMDAAHCLELGFMRHQWEQYEEAYGWLIEAWKRMNPQDNSSGITTKDILQYLIWAEYKTGRIESALNHTNELLKEEPDDEVLQQNKMYFEDRVHKMKDGELSEDERDTEDEEEKSDASKKVKSKEEYILRYEQLCRGNSSKSQADQDKLTCYYYDKDPLLLIKPVKVEMANLEPDIYLLHDIIRDSDIEFIKNLAAPRLQRASITNGKTGNLEYADYRISKSGWLEDYEGEVIERLSLKLEAVTGLSTARIHSEALQVVNYGIAGQFEPHVDHAMNNKSAILRMGMGNRIATVLIYMTDVEAGGSTVFLDAKTIIKPQKGTAAFWYNLLKSGEPDASTRHAACPVIVGTKWVCNKWIHEYGQEFRRRCGKIPEEE